MMLHGKALQLWHHSANALLCVALIGIDMVNVL